MKIERIFLDIDDVLANFTLAALHHLGLTERDDDPSIFDPAWGFDIVRATNVLSVKDRFLEGNECYTPGNFWGNFSREFWATLKRTDECYTIIDRAVDMVGQENVFLLSAPINDPECAAGKMEWIRSFEPSFFWDDRQYLIGPPKYACASPTSLLIDDSDANVNKFRKRPHFGQAILYPRPWNSNHLLRSFGAFLTK